jgi:hypothetical protein
MLAKLRDGLHAVRGLAHHLQAVHHVQQRHQSLAHHVVVLHNQHANRFLGHGCSFNLWVPHPCFVFAARVSLFAAPRAAAPWFPLPGSLVTSSVPPMAAARSRIPVSP